MDSGRSTSRLSIYNCGSILLICIITRCGCASVHDDIYNQILNGYNRKTLPTFNQSTAVNISVNMAISSLNDFDELSGQLRFAMLFEFRWQDDRLSWNDSQQGMHSLLVDTRDIWMPQLYVLQPSNRFTTIGGSSGLARLRPDGRVKWLPAEVFQLACAVDVKFFPFDTQRCLMTVSGWTYLQDEVLLHTMAPFMSRIYYTDHSQWRLLQSPIANDTIDGEDGPTCVSLTLVLQRKSEFCVVYIIVPIVFLGLMNSLVFLIPASSGERSSVAITTFLSFIVYMGIINDIVPQSSAPVAYIYYYVLFLMVYSSTIMFLCIMSQRIYDRDGVVSAAIRCMFCLGCSATEKVDGEIRASSDTSSRTSQVTWKQVGRIFDKICFLILLMTFFAITTLCFYTVFTEANSVEDINVSVSLFS